MNFWSLYLESWLWLYLIIVPISLLFLKKNIFRPSRWQHLLALITLLSTLIILAIYARSKDHQNLNASDCWIFDLYNAVLAFIMSMIYVGFWEAVKQCWQRFFSENIVVNSKHHVLSKGLIFIFGFVGLNVILMFLGYRHNTDFMLSIFLKTSQFILAKLMPLFC